MSHGFGISVQSPVLLFLGLAEEECHGGEHMVEQREGKSWGQVVPFKDIPSQPSLHLGPLLKLPGIVRAPQMKNRPRTHHEEVRALVIRPPCKGLPGDTSAQGTMPSASQAEIITGTQFLGQGEASVTVPASSQDTWLVGAGRRGTQRPLPRALPSKPVLRQWSLETPHGKIWKQSTFQTALRSKKHWHLDPCSVPLGQEPSSALALHLKLVTQHQGSLA